jgi:Protein of unknown function (DUF3618)
MTLPARVTYGWSGDDKTPAEIERDIQQTRYRLEDDLHALQLKLAPRRILPVVGAALAVVLAALIRRARHRRR